ncbi:MAG: hypothetical protein A3H98_01610 [Bacteroidetes bacterium RIFCSPLOWO2_02_FULL_36_8]|nr:MAG: hypothetical protein A3H98_01610 [Bacteroidetes bacterium RIFCSPLOWO2_02_FULL_36_8]
MKKFLLSLTFCGFSSLVVTAQIGDPVKTIQAIADTIKMDSLAGLAEVPELPKNYYTKTLSNGLEVIVIEDKSVPLVSINITLRNGAFAETPQTSGITHLYEHLFFKPNTEFPTSEQFSAKMKEIGFYHTGITNNESVCYSLTVNKNRTFDAMNFLNTCVRYPLFTDDDMRKELGVVEEEFMKNKMNPASTLMDELNNRLWGAMAYKKNTLGNWDVIKSLNSENLKALHGKVFNPNNTILIIAGDVKRNDLFNDIQTIFGEWAEGVVDQELSNPTFSYSPVTQSQQFITLSDLAKFPIFLTGFYGPDIRNDLKGSFAGEVLTMLLSNRNSRFQKTLLENGLAYQADFKYESSKLTSPIMISFVPNPATVEKALAGLIDELNNMDADDYFSEEQIQWAKDMLDIQESYSREMNSSFVSKLGNRWAMGSIGYLTDYIYNLRKVTKADIQEFVRKYIKNKPNIMGALVSEKMKGEIGLENFFASRKNLDEFMLFFKPYQMELDSISLATVDKISKWMTINPKQKIKLNGWADFTGPEKLNIKLSTQRGRSVFKRLITLGVDSMRMASIGRGEGPTVTTQEEKAHWRRVDLEYWKPGEEMASPSSQATAPSGTMNPSTPDLAVPTQPMPEKVDSLLDKAIKKSTEEPAKELNQEIKKTLNQMDGDSLKNKIPK